MAAVSAGVARPLAVFSQQPAADAANGIRHAIEPCQPGRIAASRHGIDRRLDNLREAVEHRVWIDAHGPGLVCEFQRAMVGVSSHLVRLDATGANVELKLERKGNRQLRWLLAPSSPAEPGNSSSGGTARSSAGSSGAGSAATLALLLARPPPLPAIAPDVTGQWLCHYCFVDDVLEVAELLLQQLVVCCSAASRLLSAATPAAVRADLEGALLADRAAAVAAAAAWEM